MLTNKKFIEYALKGVNVEIEKVAAEIKKGYKLIEQIDNGEKVKTPKTKFEILEIITKKDNELKNLEKDANELKWQLSEIE